jgi:outer membrane biogenesis lipoprotein LolB
MRIRALTRHLPAAAALFLLSACGGQVQQPTNSDEGRPEGAYTIKQLRDGQRELGNQGAWADNAASQQ